MAELQQFPFQNLGKSINLIDLPHPFLLADVNLPSFSRSLSELKQKCLVAGGAARGDYKVQHHDISPALAAEIRQGWKPYGKRFGYWEDEPEGKTENLTQH